MREASPLFALLIGYLWHDEILEALRWIAVGLIVGGCS
jgi:drug/metabolite transporter (DMT)-like permease